MKLYKTVMRHPSEWCPEFRPIIDDDSFVVAGKWIVIDLDDMHITDCGGRCFRIIDSWSKQNIHSPGTCVCEHNVVIGD